MSGQTNTFPASGNVGIGTNTPQRPLDINGTARLADGASMEWGGTSAAIAGTSSSNALLFRTTSLERMRIDGNGNVGIGTTNPTATLHLGSSQSSDAWMGFGVDPGNFNNGCSLNVGYGGTSFGPGATFINARPCSSGTPRLILATNNLVRMLIDSAGNVGIGTANPQRLLHVAGTIRAEEILVTSTGADYVFAPGYRLKPLSEVALYIQANHHLPDIPSADEVKKNGMGLGEMEAKLLAKVEELTLHIIQQEKDNQELRAQNQQFQERLARIELQVAR